jgi:hypothetical protein
MASKSLTMAAHLPRLTTRPVEREGGCHISPTQLLAQVVVVEARLFSVVLIHRGSSKRRLLLLLAGILERHWPPVGE